MRTHFSRVRSVCLSPRAPGVSGIGGRCSRSFPTHASRCARQLPPVRRPAGSSPHRLDGAAVTNAADAYAGRPSAQCGARCGTQSAFFFAMWWCCDVPSSDDDEHNTGNSSLLACAHSSPPRCSLTTRSPTSSRSPCRVAPRSTSARSRNRWVRAGTLFGSS